MRLPKKHLADSVAERILTIALQMQPKNKIQMQGEQLDSALVRPIGNMEPLEGIEDAIASKALRL